MKKSRTSFALINLAAIFTRPLERFYRARHFEIKNHVVKHLFHKKHMTNSLTLKLASISLKTLVLPRRAVHTKLSGREVSLFRWLRQRE